MDTNFAVIPVPGLDHSLPPLTSAPLSALDESSPCPLSSRYIRKQSTMPHEAMPGKHGSSAERSSLSRRRSPSRPAVPSTALRQNLTPSSQTAPSGTPKHPVLKKTRRAYAYWTDRELQALLEGVCMTGGDFERVALLVRTRDAAACRKQLRAIATRIRAHNLLPPGGAKEECVSAVLQHLNVRAPNTAASRVPRRGRAPTRPSRFPRKVSIQAIPAEDSERVRVAAAGRNPCVEIVLRAHRRVWDVVAHLYAKWGHPLQLFRSGSAEPLCVDDTVAELEADAQGPNDAVRVSYRFLHPHFDAHVLGNPGGRGAQASRKRSKRTYASNFSGMFSADDFISDPSLSESTPCLHSNLTSTAGQTPHAHTLKNDPPKLTPTLPVAQNSTYDMHSTLDNTNIEGKGALVMGRLRARLDSLQPQPEAPSGSSRPLKKLCTSNVTGTSQSRGAAKEVKSAGEALCRRADPLSVQESSLDSFTRNGAIWRQKLPGQDIAGNVAGNAPDVLSGFNVDGTAGHMPSGGSLFGNLPISVDLGNQSVSKLGWNKVLGPEVEVEGRHILEPRRSRDKFVGSDNAVGQVDDCDQMSLPPRLGISGNDGSLNFSLIFGDAFVGAARVENSGLVP